MTKPREWWLPLNTLIINSDKNRPNGIHVVEHSALTDALAEITELKTHCELLLDGAKMVTLDEQSTEIERWKTEANIRKCAYEEVLQEKQKQSEILAELADALELVSMSMSAAYSKSVAKDALEKYAKWKGE